MVNQIGSSVFAALADATRLQVIGLLRGESLPAGELARNCGMSRPAMSRHLRVLRKTGLVEVMQSGLDSDARVRTYRLRPEPFRSLQTWIEETQAMWNHQLAAFKLYAEHKHSQPRKKMRGRQR